MSHDNQCQAAPSESRPKWLRRGRPQKQAPYRQTSWKSSSVHSLGFIPSPLGVAPVAAIPTVVGMYRVRLPCPVVVALPPVPRLTTRRARRLAVAEMSLVGGCRAADGDDGTTRRPPRTVLLAPLALVGGGAHLIASRPARVICASQISPPRDRGKVRSRQSPRSARRRTVTVEEYPPQPERSGPLTIASRYTRCAADNFNWV
jgi:hypothetical protein